MRARVKPAVCPACDGEKFVGRGYRNPLTLSAKHYGKLTVECETCGGTGLDAATPCAGLEDTQPLSKAAQKGGASSEMQAAVHIADSKRLFEIGTARSSVESALMDTNGNSIGFTLLDSLEIDPEPSGYACKDCGHCGGPFRTVEYAAGDFDLECPECESNSVDEIPAVLRHLVLKLDEGTSSELQAAYDERTVEELAQDLGIRFINPRRLK